MSAFNGILFFFIVTQTNITVVSTFVFHKRHVKIALEGKVGF